MAGYLTAMLVWSVPHIRWCVHGTVISSRDILQAAGKPLFSALASGLLAVEIQAFDMVALPPLLRLGVWCVILFGVHLGIVLSLTGEKEFHLNHVRGLLKQRT